MDGTIKCEHKWVFQETQKKTTLTNSKGHYTAHYHRIDLYYCERCCELKKKEQHADVNLPFGGSHHPEKYAPVWY